MKVNSDINQFLIYQIQICNGRRAITATYNSQRLRETQDDVIFQTQEYLPTPFGVVYATRKRYPLDSRQLWTIEFEQASQMASPYIYNAHFGAKVERVKQSAGIYPSRARRIFSLVIARRLMNNLAGLFMPIVCGVGILLVLIVILLIFLGPTSPTVTTDETTAAVAPHSTPAQSSHRRRSATTDGVYESAVDKIDSGRADELTEREKQRIHDITLGWCDTCKTAKRYCKHGK